MSEPDTDEAVGQVRRGYDAVSHRYRGDDDPAGPKYGPWLRELVRQLPPRARVLDVGCGNGIPVARDLTAAGHRVTGVDLSDVQIERARALVPGATFRRADITAIDFPPDGFDAVLALYSIIHVPLEAQPALLRRMSDWTAPGGVGLIVTGEGAWTGTEPDWLGGGADMWWSHTDATTYRRWLVGAGWTITSDEFVPEGDGGHRLFRVRREGSAD